MKKVGRQAVPTPNQIRTALMNRSQSLVTIQRVAPAPAGLIRDVKKRSVETPVSHGSPIKTKSINRNPSMPHIYQQEPAVLKQVNVKPTVRYQPHRLSLDGSVGFTAYFQATPGSSQSRIKPQTPGQLQKATPPTSANTSVAHSTKDLLQFVRMHGSTEEKWKRPNIEMQEQGESAVLDSEPHSRKKRDLTTSPVTLTRQKLTRFPGSQSVVSTSQLESALPKTVVRFSFRTRTGSINGNPKPHNQDNFLICHDFAGCKNQCLFGVFDGHGVNGHDVSAFIKKALPQHIETHLPRALKSHDSGFSKEGEVVHLGTAMVTGYISMNDELLTRHKIDCGYSGSTAVSVLLRGNLAMGVNTGDSRAVLGKKDQGKWSAVALSNDHKPDDPMERCRIEKAGGRVEPFKGMGYADSNGSCLGPARVWLLREPIPGLAMSRSIGDFVASQVGVIAEPEILHVDLTKEHKFLILASDGVWEFITSQMVWSRQCVDLVAPYWEAGNIEGACEKVVKEAVAHWKHVSDHAGR